MIPQLQREAATSTPEETLRWSLPARVAFRFAFSYFLLYVYPRSVGSLGAGVKYSNPVRDLWHAVVPWVGANVLGLKGNFNEVANGSGDQLYDYVLLFCIAVTAMVAAAIWSWLDRKRPNYEVLYQWLRLFARLSVGVAMISYGANKLFRMQFPEPALATLVDTYGRSSPMGLLWAMMGMSRAYSFFGGVGEMLGGLLLFVPRLATIGALVTLAVMTNVLMLNFGYDVPRKIYSIHLIAFCLFLIWPDMRRMLDFFIFNRKTQLTPAVPLFKDRQMNRGAVLLQILILIGALWVCGKQAYVDSVKAATHLPAPVRGIWVVDQFSIDNALRPPLATDGERWQRVIFDDETLFTIQGMNGAPWRYFMKIDTAKKSVHLYDYDVQHPTPRANLTYDDSQPNEMKLVGDFSGRTVTAKLKRADLSDPAEFLLINRGMNWVRASPLQDPPVP